MLPTCPAFGRLRSANGACQPPHARRRRAPGAGRIQPGEDLGSPILERRAETVSETCFVGRLRIGELKVVLGQAGLEKLLSG